MPAAPPFAALLQRELAHWPTAQALADRLGMSSSRLLNAAKGRYPFDVRLCLKLADVSTTPASDILRAAGKGDVADLIEAQYGRPSALRTLPDDETALLTAWRRLTPTQRRAAVPFLRTLGPRPARTRR